MKTGEILNQALGLFRTQGWTVGELRSQNGSLCAVGAINTVLTGAADSYFSINQTTMGEDWHNTMAALYRQIPSDFDAEYASTFDDPRSVAAMAVVEYNNSRMCLDEIETWFEKALAEEGAMV